MVLERVFVLSFEFYLILLALVCLYVSVTDFIHREIQNKALLFLFFIQLLSPLNMHLTTFLLVLLGGGVAYSLIYIGGGDIKYSALLSMTIPLGDLPWAYIVTAFFGGFLAIFYFFSIRLIRFNYIRQEGIPYGVAISVGFYLTILIQSVPHI